MGPLRRGLILIQIAALPVPAWADSVCTQVRPNWDGTPVSAWSEAILLFGSPIALILLLATALAVRLRSTWGGLAVFVGWSFMVSAVTFFDPTGGARTAAAAEGCIGSSTLFITLVAVLSVGTLLYTGNRANPDED